MSTSTSMLSPGALAAIKLSIAATGQAPSTSELVTYAAAYVGASALAREDAVAAAILAPAAAGGQKLLPGVYSATKQATMILANHGVTNADAIAYVAKMLDGTNPDAGNVVVPLNVTLRIVSNFFLNWKDTPTNVYNMVFNSGSATLVTAIDRAIGAITAEKPFQLTSSIDVVTGNQFEGAPAYTPGGSDFVNTLQDEDVLRGSGTNPTLNVTLGSVNDAAESKIAPTLIGIETVNVKISGLSSTLEGASSAGIDFQETIGVKHLNVLRIADNDPNLIFENLQDSTTSVTLTQATRKGVVTFDWREDELDGLADVLTIGVGDLRVSASKFIEGGDSGEDQGYFFETVNVNVTAPVNIDSMTIAANVEEDRLQTNANQTLNIDVKAQAEFNMLDAAGVEFVNIKASAPLLIAKDEDDTLLASNDGIVTPQLRKMVIEGSGSVTIDGVDAHFETFGADAKAVLDPSNDAGATTVVIDGSKMTGNLFIGIAQGSDGETYVDFDPSVAGNDRLKIEGIDLEVSSGSGNDRIEVYGELAGSVTTGAGNDTVSVNTGTDTDTNTTTSYAMNATGETGATLHGVTTIDTGSGDDTVLAGTMDAVADLEGTRNSTYTDARAASINTGDGNDSVTVGAIRSATDYSNETLDSAQWDDKIYIKGASIFTGAGNDTISFTSVAEGGVASAGDGNDTITVRLNSAATVFAADTDPDIVTLYTETAQAGRTREVGLDGKVDRIGAWLDAGAGDDTLSFTERETLTAPTVGDGGAAFIIVARDAKVDGGLGNDVMNVTALDVVTVTVSTSAADQDDNSATDAIVQDLNANVEGIETLSLTIANQIVGDAAIAGASVNTVLNTNANDDVDNDGHILVDVLRFDSALSKIGLVSQEIRMEQGAATEIYQAGTATTFTLNNMRSDIALTLSANEATGISAGKRVDDNLLVVSTSTGGLTQRASKNDVTLNLDYAIARGTADSVSLTIDVTKNQTVDQSIDLTINLGATLTDPTGTTATSWSTTLANAASTTDDDNRSIENFAIKFADAQSHSLDMKGFGDNDFSAVARSASGTYPANTSFTLWSAAAAGKSISVDNVNADVIKFMNADGTAVTAANVTVRVDDGNAYSITTGSGNDVIDMRGDDNVTAATFSAVTGATVLKADTINAGSAADTDVLIIRGKDDMGINNNLLTSGASSTIIDDDVFENITGVEKLLVDVNGEISAAHMITINEAAQGVTGLHTIAIADGQETITDASTTGYSKVRAAYTGAIVIGNDFSVSAAAASTGGIAGVLIIDASTHLGATTLWIESKDDDQDLDRVPMNISMAATGGAVLNLFNSGDESSDVNVTVETVRDLFDTDTRASGATKTSNGETVATLVSANTLLTNGAVGINVTNGSFDKLTIVDPTNAKDGGPTIAEAGLTVVIADKWTRAATATSTYTFTVDASGVADSDASSATVTNAASPSTGGMTLTVQAGDQANYRVLGTANSDSITTLGFNDTVTAGAGNDVINAGAGADSVDGEAGNDTLNLGTGNDVGLGGAGNDTITGDLGADTLTGGDGNDVFVYTVVNQSIRSTPDVVTDFKTGADKFSFTGTVSSTAPIVNLGRFAVVANDGEGLNSLDGIAGGGDLFDGYYSASGTLNIDVNGDGNIADGTDYSIVTSNAVAPGDINYAITITSGGSLVRLGQGIDTIVATGATNRFVIVGSVSAAEVALYDAATSAVVTSYDSTTSGVVNYNDLLTVRTVSEATAGDSIAAPATAGDVLELFGTVDLTGVTLSGIDALVVHSNVKLTSAQLGFISSITFAGNTPHTLSVADAAGAILSEAATAAAFAGKAITVTGNGNATTIKLGGATTGKSVTEFATYVSGASVLVTAQAITKDLTAPQITSAFALASTSNKVTVDANGMDATQLAVVLTTTNLGKTSSVSNLTLSASQWTALTSEQQNSLATVVSGRVVVIGTSSAESIDLGDSLFSSKGFSVQGGGGNDTIYSSAGVDIIDLGTSGNSTVILASSDTGSLDSIGGAGSIVSTLNLDIIRNFMKGDTIAVSNQASGTMSILYPSAAQLASNAALAAAVGTTNYGLITGTYTASSNTFTFASTGSDVLFVYDDPALSGIQLDAVVLVGSATSTTTGVTGTSGLTGG